MGKKGIFCVFWIVKDGLYWPLNRISQKKMGFLGGIGDMGMGKGKGGKKNVLLSQGSLSLLI